MKYEAPRRLERDELELALNSLDERVVESALVSLAFYEEDDQFAQDHVFRLAEDQRPAVRGTAILCIGHLARLHGNLPREPTVSLVSSGLCDQDEYVRGQAESARGDLWVFQRELAELVGSGVNTGSDGRSNV
jgi:hypothetical protein